MPDSKAMSLAADIVFTNLKNIYKMVDVLIKLFRRIGIAGENGGNFIHLNVGPCRQ